MSAIGGIINFDGAPSNGGCILAWDGRLDNREELIGFLGQKLSTDRSDSAIVIAAYEKWTTLFPQRLIGDFAFSLWDPKSRTLLLARDHVGTRPLFYHLDNNRLVWSTRLEALLDLPDIRLEVNDEYVAGYLAIHPAQRLTPYKNIYAVPPAHVVSIRNGAVAARRFWGLDPDAEIRYRTDQEYEEHFLHLFTEAVRVRLRADGTVWADLSGGLDSSSIVCVADEVMKRGSVQARCLETVSAVFDESSSSDERKFISIVEQKRGQHGHHFCESEYPLLTVSPFEGLRSVPNPLELWGEYHRAVRKKMHECGARVLLSGIGGDELLTASPDPSPELADLLVQWKFGNLHQRVQAWSLALKKPYLDVLLNYSVVPALPSRVHQLHKRRQRTKRFALLQPRFIKTFDLREKLHGPIDVFGCQLPSARGQARAFLSTSNVISSGHLLAWGPVEVTFPFTHRPLVEFLQAIPPTQWIRPGQTRSLLRRALRNYLPPEIANRKGKGTTAEATLRAVTREWPRLRELLRTARVCDLGYVNPEALKSLIEQPDFERSPEGLFVLRISYLELWLRDFERRVTPLNLKKGGTLR